MRFNEVLDSLEGDSISGKVVLFGGERGVRKPINESKLIHAFSLSASPFFI